MPARNALLADAVPAVAYGRAYGFERAMDNLGAIVGPLLALALVGLVRVRTAILLSVIPGVLAVVAIVYAIGHTARPKQHERQPTRIKIRPVFRGTLGQLLGAISVFEVGNIAATLLILRATDLLEPGHSTDSAAQIAIALYLLYNIAATLTSVPAGRIADRRTPLAVLISGVAAFGVAYIGFALTGASIVLLAACFIVAGVGIGVVETADTRRSLRSPCRTFVARPSGRLPGSRASATSSPAASLGCSTRWSRRPLRFCFRRWRCWSRRSRWLGSGANQQPGLFRGPFPAHSSTAPAKNAAAPCGRAVGASFLCPNLCLPEGWGLKASDHTGSTSNVSRKECTMRGMFRSRLAFVLAALLSMAAIAAPVATASKDSHRHDLRGKVVSTQHHPKKVIVNTRSKGKVDFRVTKQTRYDHIKGFSALKPGLKVEVHARHQNGGWVATKIDRRGSHSKL